MVLIDIFRVVLAIVLLTGGAGLLVARWLLPRQLRPLATLLVPGLGIAVISAVAHVAAFAGYSVGQTVWLHLVIAGLGWLLAIDDARLRRAPRAALPGLALTIAIFGFSCLPLLKLGYLTTLGSTQDGPSYAVRTEYLQDHSLVPPVHELGKPWLDWVHSALWLRAGDTFLVGLLGFLTDRQPHELLTLVQLFCFALACGGAWAFARICFGLRRNAATLAAALLGANSLWLWVVYDNFLSQAVALSLVPLFLCLAEAGRRRRGARSAILAGLALTGLMSVYPVYGAYALAAQLAVEAWSLVRGRSARLLAMLKWWSMVAAAAIAWNAVGLWRSGNDLALAVSLLKPDGIRSVGSGNILVFPPVGEAIGLVAHAAAAYLPSPAPASVWLLRLATAVAAVVVAIGWRALPVSRRSLAAILTAAFAVFAAHQRFGTQWPRGYPYGYFKAIALVALPVVPLLAAGVFAIGRRGRGRWWAGALGIVLLATNLRHAVWTQAYVLDHHLVLDREFLEAMQAARLADPTGWLFVDVEPGIRPLWALYFLRERRIVVRDRPFDGPRPALTLALVDRTLAERRRYEIREPWFDPLRHQRIAGAGRFQVVRRHDQELGTIDWPAMRWTDESPLQADFANGGRSLTVRLGESSERLELPAAPRTLQLRIFGRPDLTVATGGGDEAVRLAPGGWLLDLDIGCLRGDPELSVSHHGSDTVLQSASLLSIGTGAAGVCVETQALPQGAAWVEQRVVGGGRVALRATVVRPAGAEAKYRLGLHVSGVDAPGWFGVWSLDFPPTGERVQVGEMVVDQSSGASSGTLASEPAPIESATFDPASGSFVADLVWWRLEPTQQFSVERGLWFARAENTDVRFTHVVSASNVTILPP